jgi:hypothetical protein
VAQTARAGGALLQVAVTRLIDPLTGSGAAVLPGHRAVAAMVTIRNIRGATYDSTASGDWSIASAAGPGAPLFVGQGTCQTPLTDFESLIGAGEQRSGCVAFSVPARAQIVAVRFSPHSRAAGRVSWVRRRSAS